MTKSIEIDFDVYKALTIRRATEAVSCNDVLRDLLKLPIASAAVGSRMNDWVWKGVNLPNGTQLRTEYKGQEYLAKIDHGKWLQGGKMFKSPSAAAFEITQAGVNGWWFWSAKRPTDCTWIPLGKLRAQ